MVTGHWKRIILIVFDVVIGVYLFLAMTAFNKPDAKATVCSEVIVDFDDATRGGFLDADEVGKLLRRARLHPLGQPMLSVDTRAIEETLRQSPFVERAECYKTQGGHVCISLRQRVPVLRVMTASVDAADGGAARSAGYYLDADGNELPGTHYASNVIVATGHISRAYARQQLCPLVNELMADRFWANQVVQLNVLRDGTVELVPRVGEHIVCLGQPTDVADKLSRLRKFYKYGLSEAGWNKYDYINVEFGNQIVCRKKAVNNK